MAKRKKEKRQTNKTKTVAMSRCASDFAIRLIVDRAEIIEHNNSARGGAGCARKLRAWEEVAVEFNKIYGDACPRTSSQLNQYYQSRKTTLKKLYARNKRYDESAKIYTYMVRYTSKTGGGREEEEEMEM
ncbi:hypothetical protein PFISCL1PPCAC_15254, partial [Pristionchus fissidentatus]